MVVKRNKAESSFLPCVAFLHDVNTFDLSVFLKIVPNHALISVLFDTSYKDLLHCKMSAWFIGVLKQECISKHRTNTVTAVSVLWSRIYLSSSPLWTRPSWAPQPGHLLYEALLSWHHQLHLQKSMLQSQTLWIACLTDPSSPTVQDSSEMSDGHCVVCLTCVVIFKIRIKNYKPHSL